MRKRMTKFTAGLAALAALAFGGAAITQAAGTSGNATPQPPSAVEQQGGAADTDNIQDPNGPDGAAESSGQSEKAEPKESGSEVAGNDGPGGHADEPGNPNADHQAQGVE